jgi:chromosome segregation ATPase
LSDRILQPSVGTSETQLERSVRELKTLSNRQVELFDRLQHLETRLDALLDRVRKCEDQVATKDRRPAGLRWNATEHLNF